MARPIVLQTTATVTPVNMLPLYIKKQLVYLVNDDNTFDLSVNFDAGVDQSGAFLIKAGEIVDNVDMSCSSISFVAVGTNATVAFRLMGV